MDADNRNGVYTSTPGQEEPLPEIARWLDVSGDIDDLIYYDEQWRHSER